MLTDQESSYNIDSHKRSTIFIIVNSFGRGGAEMSLAILASELSKLKHSVFYISLWEEADSYNFDWVKEAGVTICTLSATRNSYFTRFVKFLRLIKQHKPDFIYSAMLNSNLICQIFSKMFGISHAASIRNNPVSYYADNKFKLFVFSLVISFQTNIVFISSKVLTIFQSSSLRKVLINSSCFVLHNPIEAHMIDENALLNKFISTKANIKEFVAGNKNSIINISIASRLVEGKGILEVLSEIKEVLNNRNLQLSIYGAGPLEEDIKRYIRIHFEKGNVVFKGYESDLYKIFSNSEIFIFPSRSEGFGRAPFEALLMGNVVICNEDVSIIEEFVRGAVIWQTYSRNLDLNKITDNFKFLEPAKSVEIVKELRAKLSPKAHAIEFEKIMLLCLNK